MCCFFFFRQKTAYELRISDWSSDVCSSDLQSLLWSGACRALSYRWLAGWGHAPDGVRKVVGDDEGATRVHAHPDRPATSLSVRPSEAETGRASCQERVCQYV